MPRKLVPREVEDEVLQHLKDRGEQGGSFMDIWLMSQGLAQSAVRDGLFTLEQKGKATRHPQHRGRAGRAPDVFRIKEEEP